MQTWRGYVRLAKQRSGYAFTRATGQRLWQESYFDRTVRNVEELPALVEYMIRNPLRAGLVAAPEDYPHWGSQRYYERGIAGIRCCGAIDSSTPGLETRGSTTAPGSEDPGAGIARREKRGPAGFAPAGPTVPRV